MITKEELIERHCTKYGKTPSPTELLHFLIIARIIKDVEETWDLTAVIELLQFIPVNCRLGYLDEEQMIEEFGDDIHEAWCEDNLKLLKKKFPNEAV